MQAAGTAPRDSFPAHWRSPDVRGVLRAMCGRGCAYCGDLVGRTGEDVEHYRPKSLYWYAAYSLPNYLSSCRRCNSSRKGNAFPLDAGAARALSEAELRAEKRLLLDPVADDVERALRIELVSRRYSWEVAPGAPAALHRRAAATICFFHLNDDGELVSDRLKAIQDFLEGVTSTDEKVRAHSLRKASRFVPHGAAVRSVLRQQNVALLPTVVDEVQWWLTELVQTLEAFEAAPQPDRDNQRLVLYAIATLGCRPPRGVTRTAVAGWLRALGVADKVAPLIDELGGG